MKVLTCYSLKGGVGKTTTAINVAYLSSKQGYRTLLIDLDPQGSASWMLRTVRTDSRSITKVASGKTTAGAALKTSVFGTDYEGLDLIPYGVETLNLDAHLATLKSPSKGIERIFDIGSTDYELIVVDLPPSAGPLAKATLVASDLVIFVMTPSKLSLHALEEAKDRIPTLTKRRTRVLFTMVDPRRHVDLESIEEARASGSLVLETQISRSTLFDRMQDRRAPISLAAPKSKAADSYLQLYHELATELGL